MGSLAESFIWRPLALPWGLTMPIAALKTCRHANMRYAWGKRDGAWWLCAFGAFKTSRTAKGRDSSSSLPACAWQGWPEQVRT